MPIIKNSQQIEDALIELRKLYFYLDAQALTEWRERCGAAVSRLVNVQNNLIEEESKNAR